MADIFISYSRGDRERVEKLAAALAAEGFSVWWDRNIVGGAEFSKDIERELGAAKAVIVAWSAAGNDSPWVKDEATAAREQGKLVPVSLDGSAPPMGFRQYQAIDFSLWRAGDAAGALDDLKRAVKARLTGETQGAPVSHKKASWTERLLKPARLAAAGVGALALIAVIAIVPSFVTRRAGAPPDEGGGNAILRQSSLHPEEPSAQSGEGVTKDAPTARAIDAASVAVLPFADLSANQDQEYFSDGISEEILNQLIRVSGLKVVGRTSSFAFKGKDDDLRAIGRALSVAHILEGSVRTSGDRVRVTVQLIKADDGFNLWSSTFDRTLTDIFAIQDEIAATVVKELEGRVIARRPDSLKTEDAESYRFYLLGRAEFNRRTTDGMRNAIEHYTTSIARDPDFAPAHAALAVAYAFAGYYSVDQNSEYLTNARDAAEHALKIDPENAEAVAAFGYSLMLEWRFAEALPHMERAVAIAPTSADAWNVYGDFLTRTGDFEKALAAELKAFELDPLSVVGASEVASVLTFLGRIPEALDYVAIARKINPLHLWATGSEFDARIYGRDYDGAARVARSGIDQGDALGRELRLRHEGNLAAVAGDDPAFEAVMRDVLAAAARSEFPPARVAQIYASAHRWDEAAKWLERGVAAGDVNAIWPDGTFREMAPENSAWRALFAREPLKSLADIRTKNNQYQAIVERYRRERG